MNVELSWEAVAIILNTLLVLVSVLIIDVIVVTTGLCELPCINWCRWGMMWGSFANKCSPVKYVMSPASPALFNGHSHCSCLVASQHALMSLLIIFFIFLSKHLNHNNQPSRIVLPSLEPGVVHSRWKLSLPTHINSWPEWWKMLFDPQISLPSILKNKALIRPAFICIDLWMLLVNQLFMTSKWNTIEEIMHIFCDKDIENLFMVMIRWPGGTITATAPDGPVEPYPGTTFTLRAEINMRKLLR